MSARHSGIKGQGCSLGVIRIFPTQSVIHFHHILGRAENKEPLWTDTARQENLQELHVGRPLV